MYPTLHIFIFVKHFASLETIVASLVTEPLSLSKYLPFQISPFPNISLPNYPLPNLPSQISPF